MVAVPKDILIKLVEHQIESEQLQQQKAPSKCQCHCQCGRYPNDMLIVDKVMTDILESSSKEYNIGNYDNNSNNNNGSTPSSSISSHNSRRDSSSFFGQPSSRMDTTETTSSNSIPETTSVTFFGNANSSTITSNPLSGIQTDFLSISSINNTTADFSNCNLFL